MYYKYRYKFDDIIYKIALYIRLSREDGDDLESESISNQRSLLLSFLNSFGIEPIEIYIDDGYSGCNFNRPGFKKMLKDIENGKINCVITKDLSRLGRDHIDTGYYIERYFPENRIRYIALNDDFDTFSEKESDSMITFKLSFNDMYAKDISKKVRATLNNKKMNGEFCGSQASYGYMKSKEDKHRLVPNPETAPVVKKIFDLYVSGYTTSSIAQILTREEIKTPTLMSGSEKRINNADHPEIWKDKSINNILKNPVYTGCLVQHKVQNVSYKSKKKRKLPKDEWYIVENTHEPIIDKETFKIAESIRNKSNNYYDDRRNVDYVLSDVVYCKDCGSKMSISYDKKRDRVSMNCNNYKKFSKYGFCFSHYINYDKLQATIYDKLKKLSLTYMKDKNEFENIIKDEYLDPKTEIDKKIKTINFDISKLKKKEDSLYNDKFEGVITSETYKRLYASTEKEIRMLENKLIELKQEEKNLENNSENYQTYSKIVEDYLNIKNPTKELINKIIDKVYISKDKEVEICYKIKKC